MRAMTQENLKSAFAGESQAHMKYLIFADKAEQEGRPNIARLFRAIAYAERVHATNHFRALNGVQSSADNLDVAIAGETYEVDEMYPSFLSVAELQEEQRAETSMNFALQTEKVHAAMYGQTKEALATANDAQIGAVSVCDVCGYTIEGELPEKCPICGAPQKKFINFA